MRILIVEDEPVAGKMLKKIITELLGEEITTIKLQQTLTASQCYLWEYQIDLLFLDLELSGEDGFELIKNAAAGAFHTIIVSGHPERAIEAYEHGVIDFVPKPYNEKRIKKALDRYRSGQHNRQLRFLSIAREGKISLIPIDKVRYFEAHGRNVRIFQDDDSVDLYNKSLQELEKILSPDFTRVHKSYIIRINDIRDLTSLPGRKYIAKLKSGDEVPLSRNIYPRIKKTIKETN